MCDEKKPSEAQNADEQQSEINNPIEAQDAEEQQSEINNPIEALLKSYEEIVQEKLQEFDIGVEKPLFVPIPNDVDKATPSHGIVEYANSTFEFDVIKDKTLLISVILNGVFDVVKKIKDFPNNKTDKHGEATMNVQIRTDKGTLTSPFNLDFKAKSKSNEFKEALNKASNYLIYKGSEKTLDSIRDLLNKKCSDTVFRLPNSGTINFEDLDGKLYKNAYSDGIRTCWANEFGIITLPTGKRVMLNDSLGNKAPLLNDEKSEVMVFEYVKELLSCMDVAFNGSIGPFLALGLGIMSIYADKIWAETCGFPIGFLYGASKQGKSTMQNIINYVLGFDNTFMALGNSTPKSIWRKCNLYNDCLIPLNDISSRALLREGFENLIIGIYERDAREKMANGNEFNILPICSPMILSSNYLPIQKEKMLNRMLPIYFEKNSYNSMPMQKYYKQPRFLSQVVPEFVSLNSWEKVLTLIQKTDEYFAEKTDIAPTRETHNVAVAYAGLLLLEEYGEFHLENQEDKILGYLDWYLSQFKELEEPIDAFLNNLPMLMEEERLLSAVHLKLEDIDERTLLTFRTSFCLNQFNLQIGRLYPEAFINPKEFMISVKESQYFVVDKNVRYKETYKRIPPIDKSIVLDITEHFYCSDIRSAYKAQQLKRSQLLSNFKQ